MSNSSSSNTSALYTDDGVNPQSKCPISAAEKAKRSRCKVKLLEQKRKSKLSALEKSKATLTNQLQNCEESNTKLKHYCNFLAAILKNHRNVIAFLENNEICQEIQIKKCDFIWNLLFPANDDLPVIPTAFIEQLLDIKNPENEEQLRDSLNEVLEFFGESPNNLADVRVDALDSGLMNEDL